MRRVTPLMILGLVLSQVGCDREDGRREQEQAKQARAEADEKAFAVARETERKTRLINDEVARKEAEVKKLTGQEKVEAQKDLQAKKRDAEQEKRELTTEATREIEQAQQSAEAEERQAYPASSRAERLEFQRVARQEFERIEQRAVKLKSALPTQHEQHAALDGIITQSRQARQNLGNVSSGDAAAYRAQRATIEKQLSNLKASLDQLGSKP